MCAGSYRHEVAVQGSHEAHHSRLATKNMNAVFKIKKTKTKSMNTDFASPYENTQ